MRSRETDARPTVETVVARLIRERPQQLSALERVIGPIDFLSDRADSMGFVQRSFRERGPIERVSIGYFFDIHHERPYSLDDGRTTRDPGLMSYDVTFRVPWFGAARLRKRVDSQLDAAFGTSIRFAASPFGPGARNDHFVTYEGRLAISWFSAFPDWSLPPADERLRTDFLGTIAAAMRARCSHDELIRRFESAPRDVRIRCHGALNGDDYQFAFEPGMDAIVFARALGIENPLAFAGDVHRSHWTLFVRGGPRDAHPNVAPSFGPWTVDATLDHAPRLRSPHRDIGFTLADAPALIDCEPVVVRAVQIHPRDRSISPEV